MIFEEKLLETKEAKYSYKKITTTDTAPKLFSFCDILEKMVVENDIKYFVLPSKAKLYLIFAFNRIKRNLESVDTTGTFLYGTFMDKPVYISQELTNVFLGFNGRKPTQNQLNDLSKIEDRIIAIGKIEK